MDVPDLARHAGLPGCLDRIVTTGHRRDYLRLRQNALHPMCLQLVGPQSSHWFVAFACLTARPLCDETYSPAVG